MSQFNLVLKPVGDACLHSCKWCYFLHTQPPRDSKWMTLDMLEVVVKNYQSSVAEPAYDIHGGEPCLRGVGFYKEAVRLSKLHRPKGQRPACFSFQTSGTMLNEEWVELFKGDGEWYVGISIDGEDNSARGIPTEDIVRGIELLRSNEIPYSLMCTVHRDNVEKPKETVRYLATLGGHCQFIPAHRRERGADDPGPTPGEWWQFLAGVKAEKPDILVENFETMRQMKRTGGGSCTNQECGSHLVVMPTGDAFSCDFFVEDDWNLGNVRDARLGALAKSERMGRFKALHHTPHADCEPCTIKRLCNRGCPRDRYLAGGFEAKNPLCEGTEFLARVT